MPTRERTVSPQTEYHRRLAEGELSYQRCAQCGAAVFYPRVVCPSCGSTELRFKASAGLGTVYSTTTVTDREGVRVVVLVNLDEGFRMLSTVRGVPAEQVAIGQRVSFEPAEGEDGPLAVFVPAEMGR
jgi:uncharacterized protein